MEETAPAERFRPLRRLAARYRSLPASRAGRTSTPHINREVPDPHRGDSRTALLPRPAPQSHGLPRAGPVNRTVPLPGSAVRTLARLGSALACSLSLKDSGETVPADGFPPLRLLAARYASIPALRGPNQLHLASIGRSPTPVGGAPARLSATSTGDAAGRSLRRQGPTGPPSPVRVLS